MRTSCCMIVKNEAAVLEETLKAARSLFDEIVVVDTGSEDDTCKIAMKYCDKLEKHLWKNDFSEARNYSISLAQNDWIFVLDADEKITSYEKNDIEAVIEENSDVLRVLRRNIMHNGLVYTERIKRFFNKNEYHYEGTIHEQLVANKAVEGKMYDLNIILDHIGYQNEVLKRTKKLERNINMLLESLAHYNSDPYNYYQLGKAYTLAGNLVLACENYEKAISLTDNHLLEYVEDLIESYGYTLLDLKQYHKALIIEKYYNIYGNKPDFCFLLGLIYMNNAYFDKAVQCFKECIGKKNCRIEGVNSFLPAYNIGVIYECIGNISEALKWYKICKSYKPAVKRIVFIEKGDAS